MVPRKDGRRRPPRLSGKAGQMILLGRTLTQCVLPPASGHPPATKATTTSKLRAGVNPER